MRLQKLDVLRGIAITGMVLFHANYILIHLFWVSSMNFSEIAWYWIGRSVAVLFIFLAGVSFFLSTEGRPMKKIFQKSLIRMSILAAIALSISIVTYSYFSEERISWGIIHFFASASIVGLLFLRSWRWNILIGIIVLILGNFIQQISIETSLLVPLWFIPNGYYSADYYPLIPWFGYYLIGHGIAFYLQKYRLLESVFWGKVFAGSIFALLGRHSLLIYVIHVPILYVFSRIFLG